MEKKNEQGDVMAKKIIKIMGIKKQGDIGKTYNILNLSTGKEYTIDQYPKYQRGIGTAEYIVAEKYGESLAKFMRLKDAKKFIEVI